MDYEGYTFVFFIKKINKFFSLKCDINYVMLLLFNRRKIFLKCKFPIFAYIKLKGSNFTPNYLP